MITHSAPVVKINDETISIVPNSLIYDHENVQFEMYFIPQKIFDWADRLRAINGAIEISFGLPDDIKIFSNMSMLDEVSYNGELDFPACLTFHFKRQSNG